MQSLELLAPAKNLECGMAAISHGADAVYIGAPRYGARAAAGNSIDDISTLCNYAHQFGAKVFVTVNTIIYDDELSDIVEMIHALDGIGVDALLIQDMGLLSMLQGENLHCHLHASTQTDNRDASKVKWLASLGMKRVVLARELSIQEIAKIHEEVPETELEVFVHGALCVSYSGQCYASHHCFQRSANRGECAQFCRLAFTLQDADGIVLEKERHLLSLRDMSQILNLERLALAGAVSFKIEGRLKDADYVKNITAAYSEALNHVIELHPDKFCRTSFGKCTYSFTPNIAKSFNRGFTTYFADGRQRNMVSFDTPKAMGEPVGKVKEIRGHSFNVAGTTSFSNGDGLCYLDKDHNLVGFRVNKVEGNRIYPLRMPTSLHPGTQLFRNLDQAFSSLLSRPSAERKIGIAFTIKTKDNTLTLCALDECGRCAESALECNLQKAQKPQEENIVKQLSKLGGTIFECTKVEILTDAFLPSSMLAELRRMVTTKIASLPIAGENVKSHDATAKERKADSIDFTHKTNRNSDNNSRGKGSPSTYSIPYLYNASNNYSKAFYRQQGVNATSFETEKGDAQHENLLMQCRYCLRNEMGYCTRSGHKAPWRDPLTISLPDGRSFKLQFDCKKCQMNILSK